MKHEFDISEISGPKNVMGYPEVPSEVATIKRPREIILVQIEKRKIPAQKPR